MLQRGGSDRAGTLVPHTLYVVGLCYLREAMGKLAHLRALKELRTMQIVQFYVGKVKHYIELHM
jgi:hypothetical protein